MNKLSNIFTSSWKYLNSPVSEKFLSGATKAFGGNATKNAITAEMKSNASRSAAKSLLQKRLKNKEITPDVYRAFLRKSNIEHGAPKGNFVQRQMAVTADDLSHPVANTKKSLMKHVMDYDPETGGMVGKKRLNVIGGAALSTAFPAWMIHDVVKDENLSKPSKVGKSVSYAALPLAVTKLTPSFAAYGVVDSIFKSKKPPQVSPPIGNGGA